MSLKLALIGKNISHSKSESMYKKILNIDFNYYLLDYSNELEIPSIKKLLNDYYGISITAPYKKHFLNDVFLNEETKEIGAINCIAKKDDKYFGYNTDYEAIKEILKEYNYRDKQIILLGNGSMAKVLEYYLHLQKKSFQKYNRSEHGDLTFFNLEKITDENTLVINCCSRDFEFKGNICSKTIFWDLNYSHLFHKQNLSNKCVYIDGEDLLYRQALYATKIWRL